MCPVCTCLHCGVSHLCLFSFFQPGTASTPAVHGSIRNVFSFVVYVGLNFDVLRPLVHVAECVVTQNSRVVERTGNKGSP